MNTPKKTGEPVIVWQGVFPDGRPIPGKAILAQKVEFPDGSIHEFYYEDGGRPVIVLAFTVAGEVILTDQWRIGRERVLEAPGGHPDEGATPEEALTTELREETGYAAGRILKLPRFSIVPPSSTNVTIPYLALDCVKVGEPKPEKSEWIKQLVLPFPEFLALFQGEETSVDGKTLAILALALPYLSPEFKAAFLNRPQR